MNEKVDLAERELEGLGFVDLGDTTEETRQTAPATVYPDSKYGMGWTCC